MSGAQIETHGNIPIEDLATWARKVPYGEKKWGGQRFETLPKASMEENLRKRIADSLGKVKQWEILRVTEEHTSLTVTKDESTLFALEVKKGCEVSGHSVQKGQRIEIRKNEKVIVQPFGEFLCIIH
ncbi:uncharacterized protein PV07_04723 [Cladophialophora immunda]|uniref:Uncharacterized protein n=1 Tax=Cladophialophora immunda TaxID=569365 RepID=A0A0D2CF36_9EURO|nr:uncharacterized protein PV07_04723 [Cladophialophora immunda]KIW28860.1 hypothetical protein PV07_04723 [Cladophialophora immunda]